MSVPDLAGILGIPKDRIYKWQKGSKPSDMEDYMKVNEWLESVPRADKNGVSRQDTNPDMPYIHTNSTDRTGKLGLSVENQLIVELKERITKLEQDNDYLRKNNEKLMSMLSNSLQKS